MDLGRLALARNPALPLDVLERLAEEPHVVAVGTPWARIDDAKLRWLLGLGDEGVTLAAAGHARLSAEELYRRAVEADPGTGVHWEISGRPDMPPAVRDFLTGCDDVFVLARIVGAHGFGVTARARVLDRLMSRLHGVDTAQARFLDSVHMYSGCGWLRRAPVAERVEQTASPFWFLRAEAARAGHDLPRDVVAPLWDDPHPFVRLNARLHPSTPGEILTAAAREKTSQGRHAYVTHPNFPRARLLKFAVSKRPRLRRYAARHPGLPPALLADLAADPKPRVAAEARANPSLPPDVMRALVER